MAAHKGEADKELRINIEVWWLSSNSTAIQYQKSSEFWGTKTWNGELTVMEKPECLGLLMQVSVAGEREILSDLLILNSPNFSRPLPMFCLVEFSF